MSRPQRSSRSAHPDETAAASLAIGISTIGDRTDTALTRAVSVLSGPLGDAEVIVLAQDSPDGMVASGDVRLVRLQTTGVATSRNAAMDCASRELLQFADDDGEVVPDGVTRAIEFLRSNPDVSFVAGRTVDERGGLRKRYPRRRRRLRRWNSAKIGTVELMVRVDAFRRAGVRFDEDFGAGTPNHLGDEWVFVSDAIAAGLVGYALPYTIASNRSTSSGLDYDGTAQARARARAFSRVFGRRALAWRVLWVLTRPTRLPPSLVLPFVLDRFDTGS